MVNCENCQDPFENYKWYEDKWGNWKLGIQIDENLYKEHICIKKDNSPKKYWCIKCDAAIPFVNPCVHRRQEIKPYQKKGWF